VTALGWLGAPRAAALTILVLAVVAWRAIGPRGAAVALSLPGVVLVASALKPVFGVPELESRLRWPVDTFPSGHAAYAAAAGGFAAWLALRPCRRALATLFAALALAVGVAQVAESAHWPSDVVGGWTLGAAWVLGALALLQPARPLE
jgi:undecaprenyl-diphosphatase